MEPREIGFRLLLNGFLLEFRLLELSLRLEGCRFREVLPCLRFMELALGLRVLRGLWLLLFGLRFAILERLLEPLLGSVPQVLSDGTPTHLLLLMIRFELLR